MWFRKASQSQNRPLIDQAELYNSDNQLICSDTEEDSNPNFKMEPEVTPFYTYYLKVTGKDNATGSFKVRWTDEVFIQNISFEEEVYEIPEGEYETIVPVLEPADTTDTWIDWKSSDESVATVSQNGEIRAKRAGTAVITATAGSYPPVSASFTVEVYTPTERVLMPDEFMLEIGQTYTFATVPENATSENITWEIDDPDGAIDFNPITRTVTALKVGTATITAKPKHGITTQCGITVHPLLIYQTRNTETKWFGPENDFDDEEIRPDLYYNHMTKDELIKVPKISFFDFLKYEYTGPDNSGTYLPKTIDDYKNGVSNMALSWFSNDTFKPIIQDMIDHFMGEKENHFVGDVDGYNVYKNQTLTELVKGHKKSEEYTVNIKNSLNVCLEKFCGDIYALRYDTSKRFSIENRSKLPLIEQIGKDGYFEPSFGEEEDRDAGYTICIDSLHGNKIEVTAYSVQGHCYSGKLKFTYYDHFGLDETDMEGYGNFADVGIALLSGFHDWFILQHWNALTADPHPKPFVTTIEFEVPFSGEF